MSALAVTILALACADLARAGDLGRGTGRAIAAAFGAALAGLLLLDATSASEIVLVLAGLAAVVGWVVTSAHPLRFTAEYAVPLAVLALGLAVQVAALGWVTPAAGGGVMADWVEGAIPSMREISSATVLLLAGTFLAQISTANVVVRLVLSSVGALKPTGQPQASDRLRGGRLLGPMERLLILGLGLAGQPTAAGLVIAAKGLIRFPELQATSRAPRHGGDPQRVPGIDELTEYFLIGSFVSWLFALASLAFIVVFA